MQEIDRWLHALLTDLGEEKLSEAEFAHAIREKLLESYKNGLKAAGQSPAPKDGASTRRRFPQRAK